MICPRHENEKLMSVCTSKEITKYVVIWLHHPYERGKPKFYWNVK
jgi:hypothetical protein